VDYYERQAVPEADLIILQATQSYQAGAMDYLDYITNLNRALSIRQNYLDALNQYNQSVISLDFITGKLF
jgi:cobalt-zinc-cadmium resistance protein CzcA